MSLPFRSFSDSQTLLGTLVASKVSSTDIGTFYNLAYRSILESNEWSARLAETVVDTVDPYTTGTATATQGSATITGVGTTWTAAMVGRYIRIASDYTYYLITAVGGVTSLTIEVAYAPATQSLASYEIFQFIYVVDATAGTVGQILLPSRGFPIVERDLRWINLRDPRRLLTGTIPVAFILHGVDSTGSQLIEFWPRYSDAQSVRVPYYKRVDDISGSTKPLIRSDLIEALALCFCYARLASEFGDQWYDRLYDKWSGVYEKLLEVALRDDQARHNLPESVRDEYGTSLGYEWTITHDV